MEVSDMLVLARNVLTQTYDSFGSEYKTTAIQDSVHSSTRVDEGKKVLKSFREKTEEGRTVVGTGREEPAW